ncbi:hypothetical protein [Maribacter polysaccharolyticus]|uniref:hypothetical protein n=1 Tax=Maribacter polysaccharolyticus TaxID=3020831 RepID=UPI00237FC916|nr:hypothetical protein [Maribacter polysaccharolyticus]MDE3744062.1 hypothetical protein [Maribacter polysaccharolyticus]
MDYKYAHLRKWLLEHQCLSITCLEAKCGITKDTLRHFIKERRDLPGKHYDALERHLSEYGYTPLDAE